jgi:uncharacterized BrkB/YihY/UPF0761 family membrane protein
VSSPASGGPPAIVQRLGALVDWVPGAPAAVFVYQRDRRTAGSVLAAGLAFRIFLMLLPLSLIGAAALGFVTQEGGRSTKEVVHDLGITGVLVRTIAQNTDEARRGRWFLLVVGLVLLLYTASAVYRAVRLIHQVAWQEAPSKASGLTAAVLPLILIALLVVGPASSSLQSRFPGAQAVIELLFVAVTIGAWLLVTSLLPHGRAPWQALLPGVLVVGLGLSVMHAITVLYIPHKLSSSSQLYGSLGAAATLMAWLFFGCRLVVAGAVLNASLWEQGWSLGASPQKKAAKGQP